MIGVFLGIKFAALQLQEQGSHGSIICTASVAGMSSSSSSRTAPPLTPGPCPARFLGIRSGAGSTVYSASKAAVISLVQTTANQLAGTGIRVNAICPVRFTARLARSRSFAHPPTHPPAHPPARPTSLRVSSRPA